MSDRTTAFDDMDFSDVVSEPSSVAAANKKKKSAFDDMDFSDVVEAPRIAAKPSVSGEVGVAMPVKSVGAPLPTAKPITGPDHWLNVIPQGVGEAAAGIAGIGGVAVDTLLNLPRSAAAVALPRSAYESIYGTPPEVPFTATTELGADIAQSVRAGTEDVFPAPLANKRFNAAVATGDGGFVDAVTAAYDNPFGAVQEMAKQAVTTATLSPALGILPAIGVMEGGAPEQAGAAFDAEWKQGIPQQTAAYQELEAAVGPDEARRILRTQRMQRTSQLQAAAGMAAGKLSEAVGGMELEKVLAGQAAKAFGAKEVAKQAVMEMPEEIAVAAAGNIASQQTGNPELDTTKGLGGAAGLALVMGGGQAATIGGVQATAPAAMAGVAAGARKVSELLSNLGAKPTAPVDTVDRRTQVTGFKNEGLAATAAKPTAESLITQLMTPAEKAKFDKLKDPEQRRAMIDRADEKRAQIAAAMAENAADRDWVSKNDITTHPAFAAIEDAVRGGATSQAKLKEAVPGASRIIAKAAIDHLEKAGVVSPPDAQNRRKVLAPLMPNNATVTTDALKGNNDSAIQPSVQDAIQPAVQDNVVEQKNSVTLPEVGRIIARESEDVNTPAPIQTETVQAKTPKVGNYQPVAGGYESRVTAHTLGSNALDPTADAGALIYEYRKEGQAGVPMTMVVGKSGKLIPASQAVTGNKSSGEAWIPPTKDAGDAVRALLLNRGNLDAAGRAENSAQIAAIVAPRVEPKGPIRLKPMPTKVAEATVVETPTSPAAPIPAATLPAPSQNAPVAPPVQPQTPSAVVPPVTGLTPETKKRRQAAANKSKPVVATPAVEDKVFDKAYVDTALSDPEDASFTKDIHADYMKARGKSAEGTYVRQVLDGVEPTVAPTEDDSAFLKTMGLTLPSTAAPVTPAAPAPEAPAASAAPAKPKPKSKLVIKQEKEAAARDAARVAAEETAKAEEARIAAKIPSDAELAMSGMSPGEIALAKKTKPQEIFDAVNRGEISTPQGMRPVTDADIAAAKTRPDKERLTKLKAKYEQATDAPRKLPPATITNVRKEAIARAYERIKAMAQSPNMSQFDAIPSDPESTKAILGLQAAAQNSPTTEAELAKKLEDQYVENYKRNHPEATEIETEPVVEAAASPVPQGVFNVVAPGVFATSRVSESLRGLTAMWRDILKIGPNVYITTFADLEANKAQFTGEYTRILSLNRGAGTNGMKAVLADGSYIIALNPTLTTSQTLEVLGHELGHAHQEIAFDNADDATKRLLYTAYDAWARDNAQSSNSAKQLVITRAPRSLGRKISASARPGMTVGHLSNPTYWRSFNEWYADQVARWATTSDVPLTAVEKFFSRLGMAMRAFFNKARNARYLPDPSFSAYMAAVTKTAKDATSQSNKAGTISSIEEMAAITTPAEKPLTDTDTTGIPGGAQMMRVVDAAIGLARNRGIASQNAQDMIESRSGIIEAMRVEGESAIEQVKQEMVDALRGASNATKEAYKVNVLKYLHGDTTVPLPESLKKRIAELRKLIDDRSLAMIAMGLVPKDKIRTVLENIGKWTHRDFKVFNLQPGRNNHPGEYKKLVMKLAKHGRRDIVKEVVADIVNDMRVPDEATLRALIASSKDKNAKDHEDAKATLDTWARRWRLSSTLTEKEVTAKLLAVSKMDEEELQRNAVEYANYLLDPEHENAPAEVKEDFNRFKAVYADDTSLSKDRTRLPPWLKTLWGEYTDWETISLLSLENQAQIITKFTTLSRYKAELLAKGKAFKSDSPRSKVGYTLLEGKAYGPLNGYYIPNADLWLIQSANTVNAMDVALGARERGGNSLQATARRIAAGTVAVTSAMGAPFKVAAVLMNHTTVLINAGVSAVLLAGTVPRLRSTLKAIPNGFKIARASSYADVGIRTARTGPAKGVGMIGRALENGTELQRQLLFLVANNVLHDAALSADMKRKQQEQLTQEVDAMLNFSARLAKYYANPFHYYRYMKDRTSRLNSAGDEFGKYIMWASRVENLLAIDPSMPQQEAELIAAKQTVATMPSFLKSMPLARVIGNTGLIDPFLTFNTEQLRNIYNSAAIAVEYGIGKKGRAAKMYAASEVVSILVRLGAVAGYNAVVAGPLLAMMQAATDMLDDDDDEEKKKTEEEQIAAGMKWNTGEKYEAIRAAMPSYVHGGVQILRDLGDGKYVFTSGQRFDPGMAGSLLEAAMYEDDGAFEAVLKDTFFQLTPTLPALGNLWSGSVDWLASEPGTDARVKASDELSSGLKKLGDAYTPGSWKTLSRTEKAMEQGVELTMREKLLNNVGMTVQVFDSHKAASRIAADYNSVQRDAMRDVKDAMEDKEETLDFHAATLRKLALWERAKSKVDNLKAMGMDFGTVWDAVKNDPISKGINKKELVGLYEGTFPLPDYIEIVGNSRKTALVKAGTKPEEVDALYESYLKQADAAEQQMRAILESQGVTVQ